MIKDDKLRLHIDFLNNSIDDLILTNEDKDTRKKVFKELEERGLTIEDYKSFIDDTVILYELKEQLKEYIEDSHKLYILENNLKKEKKKGGDKMYIKKNNRLKKDFSPKSKSIAEFIGKTPSAISYVKRESPGEFELLELGYLCKEAGVTIEDLKKIILENSIETEGK